MQTGLSVAEQDRNEDARVYHPPHSERWKLILVFAGGGLLFSYQMLRGDFGFAEYLGHWFLTAMCVWGLYYVTRVMPTFELFVSPREIRYRFSSKRFTLQVADVVRVVWVEGVSVKLYTNHRRRTIKPGDWEDSEELIEQLQSLFPPEGQETRLSLRDRLGSRSYPRTWSVIATSFFTALLAYCTYRWYRGDEEFGERAIGWAIVCAICVVSTIAAFLYDEESPQD